MGQKYASIHIKTSDPDGVIALLRQTHVVKIEEDYEAQAERFRRVGLPMIWDKRTEQEIRAVYIWIEKGVVSLYSQAFDFSSVEDAALRYADGLDVPVVYTALYDDDIWLFGSVVNGVLTRRGALSEDPEGCGIEPQAPDLEALCADWGSKASVSNLEAAGMKIPALIKAIRSLLKITPNRRIFPGSSAIPFQSKYEYDRIDTALYLVRKAKPLPVEEEPAADCGPEKIYAVKPDTARYDTCVLLEEASVRIAALHGRSGVSPVQLLSSPFPGSSWYPVAVERRGEKPLGDVIAVEAPERLFIRWDALTRLRSVIGRQTPQNLTCSFGDYCLLHENICLDCIDRRNGPDIPLSDRTLQLFPLRRSVLADVHLFRIKGMPDTALFADEVFVGKVQELGITGFRFIPVWFC